MCAVCVCCVCVCVLLMDAAGPFELSKGSQPYFEESVLPAKLFAEEEEEEECSFLSEITGSCSLFVSSNTTVTSSQKVLTDLLEKLRGRGGRGANPQPLITMLLKCSHLVVPA